MPFNVSIPLITYREALIAKSIYTESLTTTSPAPDCHNAWVFLRSLRVKVGLGPNRAAFLLCRLQDGSALLVDCSFSIRNSSLLLPRFSSCTKQLEQEADDIFKHMDFARDINNAPCPRSVHDTSNDLEAEFKN